MSCVPWGSLCRTIALQVGSCCGGNSCRHSGGKQGSSNTDESSLRSTRRSSPKVRKTWCQAIPWWWQALGHKAWLYSCKPIFAVPKLGDMITWPCTYTSTCIFLLWLDAWSRKLNGHQNQRIQADHIFYFGWLNLKFQLLARWPTNQYTMFAQISRVRY